MIYDMGYGVHPTRSQHGETHGSKFRSSEVLEKERGEFEVVKKIKISLSLADEKNYSIAFVRFLENPWTTTLIMSNWEKPRGTSMKGTVSSCMWLVYEISDKCTRIMH